MRSLALGKDGDLVISPGGRAAMVAGRGKLLQDLSIWMRDPYGSSPLAPYFGSLLPGMIGAALQPDLTVLEARSEVLRLLQIYQATQMERLREDISDGLSSNWTREELLAAVQGVTGEAELTAVRLTANITTGGGTAAALPVAVDEEGVIA